MNNYLDYIDQLSDHYMITRYSLAGRGIGDGVETAQMQMMAIF